MRRFHALVVFDDVFMLQKLNHFDFAVKELAEKLIWNVVLRHDFDGDHRLMGFGERQLWEMSRLDEFVSTLLFRSRANSICRARKKRSVLSGDVTFTLE